MGRMSRWTPSRDTSGPWPDSRQAIFFFLDHVIEGFGHGHFAFFLLLAEHSGEHVLYIDVHFLHTLVADDFEGRHGPFAHFHLDHALVEFAFTELGTKLVPAAGILFALMRVRGVAAIDGCASERRSRGHGRR